MTFVRLLIPDPGTAKRLIGKQVGRKATPQNGT